MRYIVSYPLAAACSVKVKDRNSKFVEEYIFPQLFMQWIRKSDVVDGVRYKSSLNIADGAYFIPFSSLIKLLSPVTEFTVI